MLRASQRLGDFEIIRLLGKGGMGEVYEAQQFNPPRRVAIKVLAPWLAQDDDALRRFWREAAVPAQLDHPGIVRIITTGKTAEGLAYYTMQMVNGLSLTQLIRNSAETAPDEEPPTDALRADHTPSNSGDGPPAPLVAPVEGAPPILERYRRDRYGVVVDVGIQAARALASAHKRGALHRDIKPSNLMVDHHDQLYVVDFGLTRALMSADATCTRPGAVCGTPWYMSPEQARGETPDPRSDLYSLGVALYELATGGRGPFTASRSNAEAVLDEVRGGKVLPLRLLAPDIPLALERIILRAMHFKPRRRYQSGEEMATDLEALQQGKAVSRPAGQGVRRWIAWVGSALVLAGVLGATLWLGWLRRDAIDYRPAGPPGVDDRANADEQLPAILRDRLDNHRIDLLKRNNDPIWSKKLFGAGILHPWPAGLTLMCHPGQHAVLIALDDPGQRSFEFSIDVQVIRHKPPAQPSRGGIFFGWNRAAQACGLDPSCYRMEIQEAPGGEGQISFQAGLFHEARGASAAGSYMQQFLPQKMQIPVLPPPPAGGWRRVQVQVQGDQVTVRVEQQEIVKFDSDLYRRLFGEGTRLDPHGALGVWSGYRGYAFKEAAVTVFHEPNKKGTH